MHPGAFFCPSHFHLSEKKAPKRGTQRLRPTVAKMVFWPVKPKVEVGTKLYNLTNQTAV